MIVVGNRIWLSEENEFCIIMVGLVYLIWVGGVYMK